MSDVVQWEWRWGVCVGGAPWEDNSGAKFVVDFSFRLDIMPGTGCDFN